VLYDNELFLIKDLDFFSLLVANGVEKWYGIETEESFSDLSSAHMNKIMVSLYQSGYVDWDENKAVIRPDLGELFHILKQAKRFIYARTIQPDPFGILYYVSETNVVRVERSFNDQKTLRVGLMTKKKCAETLLELFFHKDVVSSDKDDRKADTVIPFTLLQPINQNDMIKYSYLSVLEVYSNSSGNIEQRMIVQDRIVKELIILQNHHNTWSLSNDDNTQRKIIVCALDGKETI